MEVVPPEDPVELRKRQRRIRIILVGLVLAGIAWAFAIFYSVTNNSPERLTDADREAVADACSDALEALRALPDLDLRKNTAHRDAVTLARNENDVFTTMVTRLRAIDAEGDPGVALEKWLDDWDTVIARRTEYVNELETTGNTRFASPLDIVLRIEAYAESRGLDDCAPAALQPDVIDQPRAYPAEDD